MARNEAIDELPRWIDRIGAALVAPTKALRASDAPAGRGRASGDIALLLVLTLLCAETHLLVKVGWMIWDGDAGVALNLFMMGAKDRLTMPVVLLLLMTIVLTVGAGKRRSPSDDFDLVCVALVPLVCAELLFGLLLTFGVNLDEVLRAIAYAYALLVLGLAWRQTRRRPGEVDA